MKTLIIILCLLTIIIIPLRAQEAVVINEVINVYDGDTFRVNIDEFPPIIGENIAIRILGIDTPEISIKRLAEITIDHAKELFNYKGELVFGESSDVDYLTDNPNRRCPNITKAKNMIGYSPNIDVYDGVKRSLIWYSENYEEECEE